MSLDLQSSLCHLPSAMDSATSRCCLSGFAISNAAAGHPRHPEAIYRAHPFEVRCSVFDVHASRITHHETRPPNLQPATCNLQPPSEPPIPHPPSITPRLNRPVLGPIHAMYK